MPNLSCDRWKRRRLAVETLEVRSVPALMLATGAGEGGGPHVKVFDEAGGVVADFFAYDPLLRGGVRVATGDITGDGIDDIVTAPGPGGGPHVRVFDGFAMRYGSIAQVYSFMAYDPSFRGGVHIAVADVTGDGRADIVTGAGLGGGPHVRVFDGTNGQPVRDYMAYDLNFRGGVSVAAGRVLGSHFADIVTAPGPGGGPHFKVIAGANGSIARDWIGYDVHIRPQGFSLATGYFNDDTRADIVVSPGVGGGPQIKIFDGLSGDILSELATLDVKSLGGAQVAAEDLNGDGTSELIVSQGPGMPSQVRVLDGVSGQVTHEVQPYDPTFRGGASVAAMTPVETVNAVSRSYDFRLGDHGWIAGFANVPVGLSPEEWQLAAGLETLPPELGAGAGYMMQGDNRSAELLMFLKKNFGMEDGIQPGQAYRVRFSIDLGSNMSGDVLLGGSVNLLAGASGNEPRVVPVDSMLRLTMNKARGIVDESSATLIGDTTTGQPASPHPPYVALSRTGAVEFAAQADDSGNLWLFLGTKSGFEGFTKLFYRRITVTLLPIAG